MTQSKARLSTPKDGWNECIGFNRAVQEIFAKSVLNLLLSTPHRRSRGAHAVAGSYGEREPEQLNSKTVWQISNFHNGCFLLGS
jgi:hypothetical protein